MFIKINRNYKDSNKKINTKNKMINLTEQRIKAIKLEHQNKIDNNQ